MSGWTEGQIKYAHVLISFTLWEVEVSLLGHLTTLQQMEKLQYMT
jgi:hypothetical protein